MLSILHQVLALGCGSQSNGASPEVYFQMKQDWVGAAIAHGASSADDPVKQGSVAMIGTFG